MRISLKTVAEEAGVSTAAVSYVLNGKADRVSPETAEKIRVCAEKLGYVPNMQARSLKVRKSRCIGIVILEQLERNAVRRFSSMLVQFRADFNKAGYQMSICSGETKENGYPDYIEAYLERRVDGIIYVADAAADLKGPAALLKKYHVPAVIVDSGEDYESLVTVRVDYIRSAQEFADYLFGEKGYKDAVFLRCGSIFRAGLEDRIEAAVRASAERNKTQLSVRMINGVAACDRIDPEPAGKADMRKWKNIADRAREEVQALSDGQLLFCSYPFLAEAVCPQIALQKKNTHIAVLGEFDSTPLSFIGLDLAVPFYVKNVQQRRLAKEASDRMLALLNGEKAENCLLTAETVVRVQ